MEVFMIDMVKNDNIKIVSKKSGGVLLEKEGQKVILLKRSPYGNRLSARSIA
jgi:hypothetical protein